MINAIKCGKVFSPPGVHYNDPSLTICCDLCERDNLNHPELVEFIGYDIVDLCMDCVKVIKLKESYITNDMIETVKYGKIDPSFDKNTIIYCDLCDRDNLDYPELNNTFINYGISDLCMNCVDLVKTKM